MGGRCPLPFIATSHSRRRRPDVGSVRRAGQPSVGGAALGWQSGPAEARIGTIAMLRVPDGMMFRFGRHRRFLELTGIRPATSLTLAQGPRVVRDLRFDSRGCPRREKLDPAARLKALQDGDEKGNQERSRLKMPPIYTDGWHVPPHYDAESKRLEWGVRLRTDEGERSSLHDPFLGRRGVMQAFSSRIPSSSTRT